MITYSKPPGVFDPHLSFYDDMLSDPGTKQTEQPPFKRIWPRNAAVKNRRIDDVPKHGLPRGSAFIFSYLELGKIGCHCHASPVQISTQYFTLISHA
jgi:hypothetical protein